MRREKQPAGEMTTERITTGDHKGNFGLVPADEYWEQLGRVAFDAFWYGDPHKSNWDDEA